MQIIDTDQFAGLLSELVTGRVYVTGNINEPAGLLDVMARGDLAAGLEFTQFPIPGLNALDFTTLSADARMKTFFMTPALKAAAPDRLDFLPMQMRYVYDYLAEQRFDTVLVQMARDTAGVLRMGPNVDFVDAALEGARCVVAELNEAFNAPLGCPEVDERRIDYAVTTRRPLGEMAAPVIDDAADAIGGLVAALINDGDCIQTGIGAIPAAILARLGDKNDLGLHGGLIDDGGRALIDAGNVNGSVKPIDTGRHVTGMALGSSALLDWAARTPELELRGANYTHEVSVLRQLDNFVSINSAVEVDLAGQVNAEVAGGRQISGTGGSVDFMRGAKAARGGRSIIAMNATARGGTVSRIVPRVDTVTALRTDVDIVVTEFGVARLKDLSLRERATALVGIAAPAFRDELAQTAG